MEIMQIRLPGELVKKVQTIVDSGLYSNKSEIVRDAVRRFVAETKFEDISNNKKFTILFSSDLHGNIKQYIRLFKRALDDKVNAVIIGGDVAPKDARRTPRGQSEFLVNELFPIISSFNKQNALRLHECKVYIMMGNDDFKSNYTLMKKYENKIGYTLIHNKCLKFHEDFKIIGYSYIPLTPFRYKDWEKLDLRTVSEKITRGKFVDVGIKSKGKKFVKYKFNLKNRKNTIEKDFNRLFQKVKIGKVILVSHAPPKNTNLDITTNEHVGSDALRKIIEEKQPYIVLSGHVHETVKKSGTFKHKLGNTVCMASGNNHQSEKLSAIELNLYDVEKAKCIVI